ncbi:MAG TPA: enoyl-CoA hydratase/isomerase family protein [Gemmatimonadales bacterium]|nr:enoyl-CoA hydratase/isomerase family protein [Gemmatimonadales bacterium]
MAPSEAAGTEARRHGGAEPRVLVSRAAGVATLTLNRPDKRNALDRQMLAELGAALEQCDLAADVRVVALRGAGKDFCAGLDLAELLESVDLPPEENERRAMELGGLFVALRKLPKVCVAVVEGRALAGGCGLVTACDLVVARAGAQFGYPEINRGFVPAMVMTMLRRAVGEKVAFDLAATGRLVVAEEAEQMGLISRVVPADDFEEEIGKLLAQLAGFSASALALIKHQAYALDDLGFEAGIRLGARVNAVARQTPDFRQAIQAFLRK